MSNRGRIILSSALVTDGIFMLQGASLLWARVTPAGNLEVCLEHPDMPEVEFSEPILVVTPTYTNVLGMVRRDGIFINPNQDPEPTHQDCLCMEPTEDHPDHFAPKDLDPEDEFGPRD